MRTSKSISSNRESTKSTFLSNNRETRSHFFTPVIQPRLTVNAPGDIYEQEADRIADEVMRMPEPQLQRKCAECEAEEKLQRKPLAGGISSFVQRKGTNGEEVNGQVASSLQSAKSGGQPLPESTQSWMESRFGMDFGGVRIHTDSQAIQLSRELGAQAFTHGSDIYFNQGKFAPETSEGKRLLAHELTHVVQQKGTNYNEVQRSSDFCVPYNTDEEAENVKWWLRNTYMRLEGLATFGTEVHDLYDSYLSRTPGDSLSPRIFASDRSYIHNSFKDDGYVKDDMDEVLDLIGTRLHRIPGGRSSLRPGAWTIMSLSNFLSASEMANRPINFSNPFSVSGHIAGGIGSSDAGYDYRKITRANVAIEKVILIGNTGYYKVELIPHYEVFDTIDFCPGDPGSPLEQIITTPMSRLEASGHAYDMPFKVIFSPESRVKRFWF